MSDIVSILDADYLEKFSKRQQQPIDAVPTPFPTLNRNCRDDGGGQGIARGWNVTIGGNPGHGKSLLALNLAARALANGSNVGFISLEMAPEQLAARFYALATGTPIRLIEKGAEYSDPDFLNAWRQLREQYVNEDTGWWGEFFVNTDPLVGVEDVCECMRFMHEEGKCSWFCVDYLQLVGAGSEDDLFKQVSEVANAMRLFAREHNVVVIGLSQYNRTTSANYQQSPRCQGLHGGMSLEASSDLVVLIDHSRYVKDALSRHFARTFLIIDKNRHGDSGDIPVLWDYRTLQCREALPDEENQWPR